MSEPKFTKGPWKVDDKVLFGIRQIRIRAEGYPWIVAKVADSTDALILKVAKQDMDWNVFAANAYLMRAAPEMYAMLEELATCGAIANGLYVAKIKELLTKARGEE